MDTAAKCATFIKMSALIPFNDLFEEYLDKLITDERNKPVEIRDQKKIKNLIENKGTYVENKEMLKRSIISSPQYVDEVKMIIQGRTTSFILKFY